MNNSLAVKFQPVKLAEGRTVRKKSTVSTAPKYIIKMTDGRIGTGNKYRYRNKTYYWVNGHGFYIDDVRPDEIVKLVPMDEF